MIDDEIMVGFLFVGFVAMASVPWMVYWDIL